MKCVCVLFVVFLLNESKSHVTERPKDLDLKDLKNSSDIISDVKVQSVKERTESPVYLEDVVYSLKHQNWSKEEIPCLNQTLLLLRNLQNFTLWAVWAWDSVSSQPQGILYGTQYELGNFDECLNPPWAHSHPGLKSQYCLADIVLERTDHAVRKRAHDPVNPYQSALDFMEHVEPHAHPLNEITWGVCVPTICSPAAVEKIMAILLAHSHFGLAGMRPRIKVDEPCQRADEPRPYDAAFYSFFIVTGAMTVIVLICTLLDNRRGDYCSANLKSDIIKSFSLMRNGKSIMEMKKEGIEVLYGIRFISICLIVMDHQVGIMNAGPVSDGIYVNQVLNSTFGMLMSHDDLFVDTFFLLSAFLTATTLRNFKRVITNPIPILLKRYVRLVVAFAILVFFMSAVFPYAGNGPLWNRAVKGESAPCRENWWLSLLMLSNYIHSDNICSVVSWYIPCDFHFFVVTVLVYWLYQHMPRLGLCCAAVLTVAAVVLPGYIVYSRNLPAIQLFTQEMNVDFVRKYFFISFIWFLGQSYSEPVLRTNDWTSPNLFSTWLSTSIASKTRKSAQCFVQNPRASVQFQEVYIKSHTRFAAYLVGFYSGYLFIHYRDKGSLKTISKFRSIIGVCVGLFIMTTTLFLGHTYLWRDYHPLEGAVYASLNRPLWAIGVAVLVLSCSLGTVPIIKKFLSWYAWAPLSRLAYGLYLIHCVLIIRNSLVSRNPVQNDIFQILTAACGVIMLSCFFSLLIWMIAEAPINNLLVILLKRSVKIPERKIEDNQASESRETVASSSAGHLSSNLPPWIETSSKI